MSDQVVFVEAACDVVGSVATCTFADPIPSRVVADRFRVVTPVLADEAGSYDIELGLRGEDAAMWSPVTFGRTDTIDVVPAPVAAAAAQAPSTAEVEPSASPATQHHHDDGRSGVRACRPDARGRLTHPDGACRSP